MPSSSEKQRRFMGIVHGMQTGTVPKSSSKKAAGVAKEIDPEDSKDFAKKESDDSEDENLSLSEMFKELVTKYTSK